MKHTYFIVCVVALKLTIREEFYNLSALSNTITSQRSQHCLKQIQYFHLDSPTSGHGEEPAHWITAGLLITSVCDTVCVSQWKKQPSITICVRAFPARKQNMEIIYHEQNITENSLKYFFSKTVIIKKALLVSPLAMIAATDCDTSEIVEKDNSIGGETDVTDVTISMKVPRHQK